MGPSSRATGKKAWTDCLLGAKICNVLIVMYGWLGSFLPSSSVRVIGASSNDAGLG